MSSQISASTATIAGVATQANGLPVILSPDASDILNPVANAEALRAKSARERILLSAYRLFYAQGIRATGIDLIISEASVTKVTFYRHFPSKQHLVLAFLQYRHERWLAWFTASLARHRDMGLQAVAEVLREWFQSPAYRGCAFINTAVEFGDSLPEALQIGQDHKRDMRQAVADAIPLPQFDEVSYEAISLAIDGAIVRAQRDEDPNMALKALGVLLSALEAGAGAGRMQAGKE